MEDKLEKNIPNCALAFYIEIYCKKKGETEKCTAVPEAIKSWTTLNKSEKQIFAIKYNEYRSNFKKSIAMHLKNAEPYLRSKETIPNRNSTHNANNQEIDSRLLSLEINSGNVDQTSGTQYEENTKLDNFNQEISNICSPIRNTTSEDGEMVSIAEPIAPKIISSKELFLLVKEREDNDLIWEEVTLPQKKRYQEAVLCIKKKYLKQYREYLEHLSSKKLFNHYRDIINSE